MNRKTFEVFFEEAKLAHLNWHRGESNFRPYGGAYSQVNTTRPT